MISSAIDILDHLFRDRLLAPITLTTNSFSRGGHQQHVLSSQPRTLFLVNNHIFGDFSCVVVVVVEGKQAYSLQFLAALRSPFCRLL